MRRAPGSPGPASAALACLLGLATLAGASAGPSGTLRPDACGFTVDLSADPTAGSAPLSVQFNASVSAGTPELYQWSFGDGSFWNASGPGAATPVHDYGLPGSFTAGVEVDEAGCEVAANVSLAAVAGPITLTCSARPLSGVVPLSVTFLCTAGGGSGTYVSSLWSFGDGGEGSGLSVTYTYERAGRFTAVVNVTDSLGHWSLATIAVDAEAAPEAPTDTFLGIPDLWVLEISGAVAALLVAFALGTWTRARRPPRNSPYDEAAGGPAPGPVPETLAPPSVPEPRPELTASPAAEGPSSRVPDVPIARSLPSPDALRLSERVVVHLAKLGRLGPDELARPDRTQAGMGEALQVGQNSLTNVLRRLEAADVLWHEVRHVEGRPRRLKVYGLTARGEALGKELRARSSRTFR